MLRLGRLQNCRQRMNAPPMRPILMATLVHRCNADCIAWWRGSRASLEATGRHHRASIRTILPRRTTRSYAKKHHTWWPFWWPCRCAGTILYISPDGGGLLVMVYVLGMGLVWGSGDEMVQWDIPMRQFRHFFKMDMCVCTMLTWQDWKQHRSVAYQTDQKNLIEMIGYAEKG
jgi:hypothetical protein